MIFEEHILGAIITNKIGIIQQINVAAANLFDYEKKALIILKRGQEGEIESASAFG